MSRIRRSGSGGVSGGGVIDGEVFEETKVTPTKWAESGNSAVGYTYTYTVKHDCQLHVTFTVHPSESNDQVIVKLNGSEVFNGCDTPIDSNFVYEQMKQVSLPVKSGTTLTVWSKIAPTRNVVLFNSGVYGTTTWADYAIKITEYVLKSAAVKVDELYMGEPDWANQTTLFNYRISPSVDEFHLSSGTGTYTAPTSGWVRVYCACGSGITGTVVTLQVNDKFAYSNSQVDSSDCDPNTIIPVSEGDTLKLTYTQGQIEIYFIPRKKVRLDTSDLVLPSASVIDGTTWKKADGVTDEGVTIKKGDTSALTDNGTFNTSTKTITYTVKNDCYLYIAVNGVGVDVGNTNPDSIAVLIKGVEVGRLLDHMTDAYDIPSCGINVAAGTEVKLEHLSKVALFSSLGTNSTVSFKEFKLTTSNVVMPMPDYGSSGTVSWLDISSSGSTHSTSSGSEVAPADGFLLMLYGGVLSSFMIKINELVVLNTSSNQSVGDPDHSVLLPVSKGDIVKWGAIAASNGGFFQLTFIPAKFSNQTSGCVSYVVESGRFCSTDGTVRATASENDAWYRLYSDGWCEQGGYGKSGDTTITLLKSYSGTNYNCNLTQVGASAQVDHHCISSKSSNTITVQSSVVAATLDWKTEGFIATT